MGGLPVTESEAKCLSSLMLFFFFFFNTRLSPYFFFADLTRAVSQND